MKITQMLGERMTLSFEVYPPKLDQPMEPLLDELEKFYEFRPDFISCTYGAGGTNRGRSVEICSAIASSGKTTPLAHFTCIGSSRQEILELVREYRSLGIENFLGLRGDLPEGWEGTRGDFAHANELIAFLRVHFPDLCIGAAAYPERHPESASVEEDIRFMFAKEAAGADFFSTQLCHDVDKYLAFMDRVRAAGIAKPVVLGLMPALSAKGIVRMSTGNSNCTIPAELQTLIDRYGDSPKEFRRAGKEFTARLIGKYIAAGISGLHIFALNRCDDVAEILEMAGIHAADRNREED